MFDPTTLEYGWCGSCATYWGGDINKCDGCYPRRDNLIAPSKYVLAKIFKEEEKKMVVTIIGSLKREEKMETCKEFFENMGHTVHSPSDKKVQNQPLISIQAQWIKNIEAADLVVAIPKEILLDTSAGKTRYVHEFGESTSYEMAIAYNKDKTVMIWE